MLPDPRQDLGNPAVELCQPRLQPSILSFELMDSADQLPSLRLELAQSWFELGPASAGYARPLVECVALHPDSARAITQAVDAICQSAQTGLQLPHIRVDIRMPTTEVPGRHPVLTPGSEEVSQLRTCPHLQPPQL